MSTYRYNYLRAPNYPSTVWNNLRGPAFVAPFSPDELVETSLWNEFGNQWPLLRVALRYHGIVTKLIYVLQIWGETLRFRKVRSTSLKMHATFFTTFIVLFFSPVWKSAPFGSVPKKARYITMNGLTLISNMHSSCIPHTCMHEVLKTEQLFKSERYRKIFKCHPSAT